MKTLPSPLVDTTLSTRMQQCVDVIDGVAHVDVDGYNILKLLDKTVYLVRVIGQSTGDLFTIESSTKPGLTLYRLQPTTLAKGLLDVVLKGQVHRLPEQFPQQHFSAEITLLCKVLARRGLSEITSAEVGWNTLESVQALPDAWNLVVQDLREAVSAPGFQEVQRKLTRACAKNLRSANRWLDNVFAGHVKVLALRIDLHYLKLYEWQSDDLLAVELKEIFQHRAQFLHGLAKWIDKDALLGYLCKTEYKCRRNLHHHVLILVDGNKLREDFSLIAALGNQWRTLTQGRGTYRNSNADFKEKVTVNGKTVYRYKSKVAEETCGVGMIDLRDTKMVLNLRNRVITYLVKPDHQIHWILPKKHRLLLKSVAKPVTGTKPGRPRNHQLSTKSSGATVAPGV